MKDAVRDWMACVKRAKKVARRSPDTYTMIKGPVLQTAQKCYCAMGY